MSKSYEALMRFAAQQSDDEVKTDLELTCTDCGEHVCDIEAGDTLDVLVSTALGHTCEEDFEDIVERQGWNADSVATLLMAFIDDHADKAALMEFVRARAKEENG